MASDYYAQEFWRERDRMAFAGLLAYGLVYVIALIVVGHPGTRDFGIACAGVTYVSYALQAARAHPKFSFTAVGVSIVLGIVAGFCLIAGI